LSYTTFAYGNEATATVTNETALESKYPTGRLTLGGPADLFDEIVNVTASLTNTGGIQGAEVA
jgi:beta-glucosidase